MHGILSTAGAGTAGENGGCEGGDITRLDQLKFEKSSFITKGNQKFRENYIIGSQMGAGKVYYRSSFKGAYGEVRMCQHRILRAIRAVKILKKSALKEEEIERFIHEIQILKSLVIKTDDTLPKLNTACNRITQIY